MAQNKTFENMKELSKKRKELQYYLLKEISNLNYQNMLLVKEYIKKLLSHSNI